MVQIKLPDGSVKEYHEGVSPREIAEGIGKRLAEAAVAAAAEGKVVDLDRPLEDGKDTPIELRILTSRDREALDVLRHSTAHIMARAIMRLFPGVRLAFGPTTANGFYYDVDIPGRSLSEDDFPAIEAEMARITKDAEPFERFCLPVPEARQFVADLGQTLQGRAHRRRAAPVRRPQLLPPGRVRRPLPRPPHPPRRQGRGVQAALDRRRLLEGPHRPQDAPARLRHRLLRQEGPRRPPRPGRGSQETRPPPARQGPEPVHDLAARRPGLDPLDAQGGRRSAASSRASSRTSWSDAGYQPVYTPHIGKIELYQTSGHYPYYKDSQFPTLKMPADSAAKELLDGLVTGNLDDDAQRVLLAKAGIPERLPDHRVDASGHPETGYTKSYFEMPAAERIGYLEQTCDYEEYLLKPMNCPHHIQIYAAQPRSYRDLPLRLAEFGTVYRYEQSGELSGLTRVRGFTQDDAHLFCTHDQVRGEFRSTMEMTQFFLDSCLGLSDYRVRLSKSDPNDPKYQGAAGDIWRRAEDDIRSVLDEMGLPYDEAPGEAAFYGPKADFIVRDCIGRQWQLGTVQLDYVLPERFDLEYIGPDNQPHRPVMIHRAPLGSMERFMGILIEHFAGAFPLWLAPEQVRVLPISDKVADYAQPGPRPTAARPASAPRLDPRPEKIGAKIRDAQLEKIPVMLVVGAKEAESQAVSYRDRQAGDLGAMPLDEALARLKAEAESRQGRQAPAPPSAVPPDRGNGRGPYVLNRPHRSHLIP